MRSRSKAALRFDDAPSSLDVGAFDAARRQKVSGPGLRAFLEIVGRWELSEAERLRVLGLPGRSTYHGWAARARAGEGLTLPLDTLLRISAVLGIHKGLETLLPRQADALEWLRGPNNGLVFGGQAPLDLITSGTQDGIMTVRRYLDAWRGGLFAAPAPELDDRVPPIADDDIVFV